jgi:hypothetical protein
VIRGQKTLPASCVWPNVNSKHWFL